MGMGKLYTEISYEQGERSNTMSDDFRQQVYNTLNQKETDELTEIWYTHDQEAWTDVAFDVIKEILIDRLGELPPPPQSLTAAQPTLPLNVPIKLLAPGVIYFVGIITSPFIGAVLASFNWRRMGMKQKIAPYIIGSLVVTLAIIGISRLLPEIGTPPFFFIVSFITLLYIESQMKKDVDSLKATNHIIQSVNWWIQCLVVLGALGLVAAAILFTM
jgi:hypothetical protein